MTPSHVPPPESPRAQSARPLLRVGILFIGILSIAFVLSYLGYLVYGKIAGPWARANRSSAEVAGLRQQRDAALAERDRRKDEIAWMQTEEGALELGRRKGMTKPGEHAVYVEVVTPPAPAETAVSAGGLGTLTRNPLRDLAVLFGLGFVAGLAWLLLRRRPAPVSPAEGTLATRAELRKRRSG